MRTLLALVLVILTVPIAAQISERAADVIVPIVGSTRGQAGSNFRTALQLTNASEQRMAGWLIFHPHAKEGSATDPAIRYDLPAGATVGYPDVIEALGATGFGSLDVLADTVGVPTVVARAFDDQVEGTKGVTVPAIPSADVLGRNDDDAIIAPQDLVHFRFNIGVRTLPTGATLNIITRNSAGVERHRHQVEYAATYFEQQPADVFAGIALQPNDSILIEVVAGAAIVYGTTVDNRTNDSAMQVLRR